MNQIVGGKERGAVDDLSETVDEWSDRRYVNYLNSVAVIERYVGIRRFLKLGNDGERSNFDLEPVLVKSVEGNDAYLRDNPIYDDYERVLLHPETYVRLSTGVHSDVQLDVCALIKDNKLLVVMDSGYETVDWYQVTLDGDYEVFEDQQYLNKLLDQAEKELPAYKRDLS